MAVAAAVAVVAVAEGAVEDELPGAMTFSKTLS